MIQDIVRHKLDYSILSVICGAFVVYFLRERYLPYNLLSATVLFGAFYIAWGIWHHARLGKVTGHLVLEYFLVALIGIVIVSSLII